VSMVEAVGDHEIVQVGGFGDHVIPHGGACVSVPGLVLARPHAPGRRDHALSAGAPGD
jgi:hypothetical protein